VRCLRELLDGRFIGRERDRYRLGTPRIKSANRLYQKLERDKYRAQIKSLESIPVQIDDLLGIRVTCTNEIDVERLREALAEDVPVLAFDESLRPSVGFALQDGSERDYRVDVRESGYRAFHLNIICAISTPKGSWEVVRCELQVRTLLQDSWGELTHEDTYKPGSPVSELVSTLSRRMADMLAVLDSLAQDVRNELERAASTAAGDLPRDGSSEVDAVGLVEGGHDPSTSPTQPVVDGPELLEAVRRYIRTRWESLDNPLHLASLAWELQGEFGSEITNGWLGYERMVELLRSSVPPDAIVSDVPGLLVPGGFDPGVRPPSAETSALPDGVPAVALSLKAYDKDFPAIPSETLSLAYSLLAEAHNALRGQYGQPDIRYLNTVTKMARDLSMGSGEPIGRNVLNYIGIAMLYSGNLSGRLTHDQVSRTYCEYVIRRLQKLSLLPAVPDSSEAMKVRDWLRVIDGSGFAPN